MHCIIIYVLHGRAGACSRRVVADAVISLMQIVIKQKMDGVDTVM